MTTVDDGKGSYDARRTTRQTHSDPGHMNIFVPPVGYERRTRETSITSGLLRVVRLGKGSTSSDCGSSRVFI